MRKEEFFNRLEYLLQDIPEEDKKDALDYYRDYLDEAGPEREDDVLTEFESPERVAAIIRTDLLGGMERGGEFTESGYRDERFERNAYPAVRPSNEEGRETGGGKAGDGREGKVARGDREAGDAGEGKAAGGDREAGDAGEGKAAGGDREARDAGAGYRAGSYAGRRRASARRQNGREQGAQRQSAQRQNTQGQGGNRWLKLLLLLVLICIASPFVIVLAAGAFAGSIGLFGFLFAALVVLAVLTFCGFVVGGILIIVGLIALFANVWIGVALLGVGFMGLGCGFLLFIGSYYFYGKFLPWVICGIANAVGGFFNRRKRTGTGTDSGGKEDRDGNREELN